MIEHLVSRLDGLVIPGGWDVDPTRYGQEPHPETDSPRPERDEWEAALILEAIRQDVPLLCICRREQLLNVTLGGTLHQHLPDVLGTGHYQLGGHQFNAIRVDIRPDSRQPSPWGRRTGKPFPFRTTRPWTALAKLIATAWSEDQIVEAIEHPGAGFCVGCNGTRNRSRNRKRCSMALWRRPAPRCCHGFARLLWSPWSSRTKWLPANSYVTP